jgi:hypothetical protein
VLLQATTNCRIPTLPAEKERSATRAPVAAQRICRRRQAEAAAWNVAAVVCFRVASGCMFVSQSWCIYACTDMDHTEVSYQLFVWLRISPRSLLVVCVGRVHFLRSPPLPANCFLLPCPLFPVNCYPFALPTGPQGKRLYLVWIS